MRRFGICAPLNTQALGLFPINRDVMDLELIVEAAKRQKVNTVADHMAVEQVLLKTKGRAAVVTKSKEMNRSCVDFRATASGGRRRAR